MSTTVRQQLQILSLCSVGHLLSAISFSMQAIFYPSAATSRGISTVNYSLVFGIFQLVSFIVSPVYGKIIGLVKPKFVLYLGLCLSGISTFAFGFNMFIEESSTFLFLSYTLRILEALGDAAYRTASFTITINNFPDKIASTFALLEVFYGIGFCIGPVIGAGLHAIGNFQLPFIFLGTCVLLLAITCAYLLPANFADIKSSNNGGESGLASLLKNPFIQAYTLTTMIGSVSFSFIDVTLEPHIRSFRLSLVHVSLLFMINSVSYCISAILCGKLFDRGLSANILISLGAVLEMISFTFYGPVPYLAIQSTILMYGISLSLQGIGVGAQLVTFSAIYNVAIASGFPDDIPTHGLVAAIWNSAFSFGSFLGPLSAGLLVEYFTINIASLFNLICHLTVAAVISSLVCYSYAKYPKNYLTV